ncbi:cytochrome P450 [Aspergillus terricola var. indicus]
MSFDAIMLQHAQGLLGLRDESVAIARDGLLADLMNVTKPLLAGSALVEVNLLVLNHAAEIVSNILCSEEIKGGRAIPDLYSWVQTVGTEATTQALYGMENPMVTNQDLVDDVWCFESGLRVLGLNVFPRVIANRAYHARERLIDSISSLFSPPMLERLPNLTRRRVEVIQGQGIEDPREIARIELALLHGATVNTIPALFWTIAHIFARPDLVARIRAEIMPLVTFTPSEEGGHSTQAEFLLNDLLTACPLLTSTYREVIWFSNQAMSTCHVMTDTPVADERGREYVLRAGCSVIMPATGHMEGDVWGTKKDHFDPERFLDWDDYKASRHRRLVYMPFGGGRHLCPGRHLAKAEILGFTMMLLVSFDMEGIEIPTLEPARLGQGVGKPEYLRKGGSLSVRLMTRKGFNNVMWTVKE